jgi:hypothetical protein
MTCIVLLPDQEKNHTPKDMSREIIHGPLGVMYEVNLYGNEFLIANTKLVERNIKKNIDAKLALEISVSNEQWEDVYSSIEKCDEFRDHIRLIYSYNKEDASRKAMEILESYEAKNLLLKHC